MSFSMDVSVLVYMATLGYVLGFLFKNQIILRILILNSSFLYILYYYYVPEGPLWAAMLGSGLIILANAIGLTSLLYDRLPIRIDSEHIPIFNSLKGVKPRDFRQLMKIASTHTNK